MNTEYEIVPVGKLRQHPDNPRRGSVSTIKDSIESNGFYGAVVAQRSTGRILVGNHRYQAAQELGMAELPVIWVDVDDQQAQRLMQVDNRSTDVASYDDQILLSILEALPSLDGTGYDTDDLLDLAARSEGIASLGSGEPLDPSSWAEAPVDPAVAPAPAPTTLAERFLAPPFSVLDTRQGYWKQRKQQWLSLGIKSEVGRKSNLLGMSDSIILADKGINPYEYRDSGDRPNTSMPGNLSGNVPDFFYKKQEMERIAGRELSSAEAVDVFQTGKLQTATGEVVDFDVGESWAGAGTSIFDPVLCEISYRWFCPPGGQILDPFAGGSVRGVVAGKLGYSYYGVELRAEQVAANNEQRSEIIPECAETVRWHNGDSLADSSWADAPDADFVFTCPPYFDLEVYSDDPADLSNCSGIDEFQQGLEQAFAQTNQKLRNDRFAVVVMGEVRDDNGNLYDLIGRTVQAAEAVGWNYYNDGILVTSVGSLALRAARIFQGGRKLARTHQYVMVFVKGDWKRAHEACGSLDGIVLNLEENQEETGV